MQLNTISIDKIKQEELKAANYFNDDLIVTNNIEHVEQFKYPCRINAITILVCMAGEIKCIINLKEYHVKANGILVNFPENIIQIEDASDFDGYAVLISSTYLEKLHIDIKQKLDSYMNLKEQPLTYVSLDKVSYLRYYYYLIKGNTEISRLESESIMSGLIVSFIFTIISIINIYQKHDEKLTVVKSSVQQYFKKFMSLLSVYHSQERSISFYAGKMNLTCNYLSSIVKEYSGKTASHWISEYVILEAKALLKFSGLNVQQVAYQLNFPSQSMFGKYFKKRTGYSPKGYMKG